MSLRSSVPVLGGLCGLLLGVLVGTSCTSGPSRSSAPPDSTTVSAAASASSAAPATESPTPSDVPTGNEADRTVAQRLEDASTAARVKQALVRTEALRPFDFAPTVVRGHLTLRGDVDTREQYREAERVASTVAGVKSVTNQVTVQGRTVTKAEDSAPTDGERPTYHTVRRGDTLIEIARAYGVSVQQLRALNDLSGPLQPGQRIRVR